MRRLAADMVSFACWQVMRSFALRLKKLELRLVEELEEGGSEEDDSEEDEDDDDREEDASEAEAAAAAAAQDLTVTQVRHVLLRLGLGLRLRLGI